MFLFVLAFGRLPFAGDSKLQILYGKYEMPNSRAPVLRCLVSDMLTINPAERPDIQTVLDKLEQVTAAVGYKPKPSPAVSNPAAAVPVTDATAGSLPPSAAKPPPVPPTAMSSSQPAASYQPPATGTFFSLNDTRNSPSLHTAQQQQQQPPPQPHSRQASAGGARQLSRRFTDDSNWADFGSQADGAGEDGNTAAAAAATSSSVLAAATSQAMNADHTTAAAAAPQRPPPPVPQPAGRSSSAGQDVAKQVPTGAASIPRDSSGGSNSSSSSSRPVNGTPSSTSPSPSVRPTHSRHNSGTSTGLQQPDQHMQPEAAAKLNSIMARAQAAAAANTSQLPPVAGAAQAATPSRAPFAGTMGSSNSSSNVTTADLAALKEMMFGEMDLLRAQVRSLADQNQAFIFRIKQLEEYVVSQKDAMRTLQAQVGPSNGAAPRVTGTPAAAAGSSAWQGSMSAAAFPEQDAAAVGGAFWSNNLTDSLSGPQGDGHTSSGHARMQ